MKAKRAVIWFRRLRCAVIVGGILLVVAGEFWLLRPLCAGGSGVTNPDAFASAGIAAGLRAAHQ